MNVGGTRLMMQLAGEYGAERFVLVSSDKAVEPSSVMGATKRVCELLATSRRGAATRYTVVRFGNVLASRGSVVPTFAKQIDMGGPVTITDPDMSRYFMSISEAASLVVQAANFTTGNDVFLLDMGEEINIADLARRMIRSARPAPRGRHPDRGDRPAPRREAARGAPQRRRAHPADAPSAGGPRAGHALAANAAELEAPSTSCWARRRMATAGGPLACSG